MSRQGQLQALLMEVHEEHGSPDLDIAYELGKERGFFDFDEARERSAARRELQLALKAMRDDCDLRLFMEDRNDEGESAYRPRKAFLTRTEIRERKLRATAIHFIGACRNLETSEFDGAIHVARQMLAQWVNDDERHQAA